MGGITKLRLTSFVIVALCAHAVQPQLSVADPAVADIGKSAIMIHALDAPIGKSYIEIQPVGSFPRRPAPFHAQIRLERTVLVPMRDGVRLSTDIYSPVGVEVSLPVVLIRLPYNKGRHLGLQKPGSDAHFFAGHGYRVVVQDMRGRFESEGAYIVSAADRNDGYDTIEWISQQPWSNGKVGTFGCSYLGENQIQLAATRHPAHAAAIPLAAGGGYRGTGRPFIAIDGGVPELASALGWFWRNGKHHLKRPADMSDEEFRSTAPSFVFQPQVPELDYLKAFWHLPSIDTIRHFGGAASDYENFFSRAPGDPYWNDLHYVDDTDQFDVPALHVNSWYDGGVNETLILFNLFRRNARSARGRDNQFAIISPTAHCMSERQENWENAKIGELSVGDIRLDYYRIYLDWFDHWVKGVDNGVTRRPKLTYYAMGANEWRTAKSWPLPNTEFRSYYLHSGGRANRRDGDGTLSTAKPAGNEAADRYRYNPGDPVPSLGGAICCTSKKDAPAGGYDQTAVEKRDDVLVYSSAALQRDTEVTGPLKVVLYVTSSAKDTDFTVKLVDVYPDGTAYNIQDGILRARFREGFDRQVFMEPGKVYRLDIDLHATGTVFRKGHRIRLQVSSSNFPRLVRNLNTGGNNFDEVDYVEADNVLHHSAEHPSHLVLPIVPRAPN